MPDLQYPIGKFLAPARVDESMRRQFIDEIEQTPARMRAAVSGLSAEQLETPYRPGGWTVRQVVHHVPDSHMNAYTRFKLALTEDSPTIKPYDEARWAELEDGRNAPIELSLGLLDAVHARWVMVIRSVDAGDFARPFTHPEVGPVNLDWLLAQYSWHGRHHVAHITSLAKRMGWL